MSTSYLRQLALVLALFEFGFGSHLWAAERHELLPGPKVEAPIPLDPNLLMGEWFMVARPKGWLGSKTRRPRVRYERHGENEFTTSVLFDLGDPTKPRSITMRSWFEDPGVYRQWKERVWGPITARSDITRYEGDFLLLASTNRKEFWLLSRQRTPSDDAKDALAKQLTAAGVAASTVDWVVQ